MSGVNIPNQCRSAIQSAYYFRNGHKPEAVVWYVYAKMTPAVGINGHVALKEQSGLVSQDIPITSTTAAWYSATFNVPAGNLKYDLQLKGDGTNSVVVYASSLIQYEA
jgi:hypothetical protein